MPRLRLLGSQDLRDGRGQEIPRLLGQPKRFALLAYLVGSAPGAFHRRDRLAALLWPESSAEQARHGLRQVLYELASHLGKEAIVRRGADEVGVDPAVVTSDVADLLDALATDDLEQVLELYGGAFLEGFFLSGAPEFEEWVETRRAELHRVVVGAAWRLSDHLRDQGDGAGSVGAARRAVELAPADEEGARRLMALLDEAGNRGEALREYELLAARLSASFDLEPSARTTELMLRIRDRVPPSPGLEPPSPDGVRGSETGRSRDEPTSDTPAPGPVDASPSPSSHPLSAPDDADLRADAGAPGLLEDARWVAALFGVVALGTLSVVDALVSWLALPAWVLWGAVVLLVLGLPVVVATAIVERHRAAGRARPPPRLSFLTWRRTASGGGAALMSLTMASAGVMGLRATGIVPPPTLITAGVLEARDEILVLDFAGAPDDAALGRAMAELLRIDLQHSAAIRVVGADALRGALDRMRVPVEVVLSESLARQVALREGVGAVLAGHLSRVGRTVVLSARLLAPADGAVLVHEREIADSEDELIAALDRLSARLRERIGEVRREVLASPPLERVTTHSLTALRAYTDATGPAGLADNQRAGLRLLDEAIALDSTFAMAHRLRGVFLTRLGRLDEGQEAIRRAYELRARLPEIDRLLVSAMYFVTLDFDATAAASHHRSVLALDPDNVIALTNLAAAASLDRDWAGRESLALRSLSVRRQFVPFSHVFHARLLQGEFDEAERQILRSAEERGEAVLSGFAFDLATARGDWDAADRALEGRAADIDWRRLADLHRLRGRIRDAERVLRERLAVTTARGHPDWEALGRLTTLKGDHGSPGEAEALLDNHPYPGMGPLDRRLLERAEAYAVVGSPERARALLAEHEETVEAGVKRRPSVRRDRSRTLGEIAYAEGRFADAKAHFDTAHALSAECTRCGLARVADSWLAQLRPDSAAAVWSRWIATHTQGLGAEDARRLPEAYLGLATWHEQRADTVAAVGLYRAFVSMRGPADAELRSELDDVRARVARLSGRSGS